MLYIVTKEYKSNVNFLVEADDRNQAAQKVNKFANDNDDTKVHFLETRATNTKDLTFVSYLEFENLEEYDKLSDATPYKIDFELLDK